MSNLDLSPVSVIDNKTINDTPYNLFLWNDPITPMDVVTYVLRQLFGFAKEKAEQLMMVAHEEGKVVVFAGKREEAESYCVRLQVAGLQASVGKDS